ncbi:MAG TPA: TetR/AcrR family transcriptional regulator [Candidatus Sulfotelmatobacter sp.]
MPRPPNPELEAKILSAAQKLWKKGGEGALTMRAVAEAAGTNTPSVYRRFRNRDDILRGLLEHIRLEIAAVIEAAPSVEQACERYLDYALGHPREYELFYQHNFRLYHLSPADGAGTPNRPAREAMRRKLAARLGNSPHGLERPLLALWMLGHGTAMLLIDKSILPSEAAQARAVFTRSVKALLKAAGAL